MPSLTSQSNSLQTSRVEIVERSTSALCPDPFSDERNGIDVKIERETGDKGSIPFDADRYLVAPSRQHRTGLATVIRYTGQRRMPVRLTKIEFDACINGN